MIRIEKPSAVVIHDGLDVSVVDGIVTIRQVNFATGMTTLNGGGSSLYSAQNSSLQAAYDLQNQSNQNK